MKKTTKWALLAVSCCLLASLARSCAPEYDETQATQTNGTTPAYDYRADNEARQAPKFQTDNNKKYIKKLR